MNRPMTRLNSAGVSADTAADCELLSFGLNKGGGATYDGSNKKDLARQVFGRAAELLSEGKCETSDDQLGGKLGETTQQGTQILKVMFF